MEANASVHRNLKQGATLWLLVGVTALASCGGGSGGAAPPSPPPIALQVVASTPPDGTANVDPKATVQLGFNQPLSANSIAPSQVTLTDGSTSIGVTVQLSPDGRNAVLTPVSSLIINDNYTLTLAAGVLSASGGALANDFTTHFSTAPIGFHESTIATFSLNIGGSVLPCVAVSDIDGDGRPDIALLASRPDGALGYQVSIYMQDATGAFADKQDILIGGTQDFADGLYNSVALFDIDGDGIPELLVPESNMGARSGIRVFKRNAAGIYASSDFITTNLVDSVTVVDVDGDGCPDLVGVGNATDSNAGGKAFQVIWNTGHGLSPGTRVLAGDVILEFAAADLAQDGRRELIVNAKVPNTGAVSLSAWIAGPTGDLTIDGPLTAAIEGLGAGETSCNYTAIADVNDDGYPDILLGQCVPDEAIVYLHQPDGSYDLGASHPNGGGIMQAFAIADMNRDHRDDIVLLQVVDVGGFLVNALDIGFNTGANDFTGGGVFPVLDDIDTLTPAAFAIADLDGDGLPDVVLAGSNLGLVAMMQDK